MASSPPRCTRFDGNIFHDAFNYAVGSLTGQGGWVDDPFTAINCNVAVAGSVVQTALNPSYNRRTTGITGLNPSANWSAELRFTRAGAALADGYVIFGDITAAFLAIYIDFAGGEVGLIDSVGGEVVATVTPAVGVHVVHLDIIGGVPSMTLDGVPLTLAGTPVDVLLATPPGITIEIEAGAVGELAFNQLDVWQTPA